MITRLLFLCTLFSVQWLTAQQAQVSGIVTSTGNNQPLQHALILVAGKSDSILITSSRTDVSGRFSITGLKAGIYRIWCLYPKAVEFTDTLILDSGKHLQLDTIHILSKTEAIREIMIRKFTNGIRVSGDTVEYLADYFKTNPGATVEDLLKKLPGIQVNRNGEITAQGEKVKKILVDGEEFFADDPSVATKYLRADMIDKVQVFDHREDTTSKSKDDNVKTLNLTLKADKKKGYFGKTEAASNFNEYTNAGAFSGYFNKSLKAAGYVKTSNFENSSLNWNDANQYGGSAGGGYERSEQYGYYYQGSSFNDGIDNRGIPFSTSAGGNFNNSWDSARLRLTGSYRLAREGIDGQIIGNSAYFLPDSTYSIKDTTENHSTQFGHRGGASFNIKADSFNTINIKASLSANQGKNLNTLKSGTAASHRINYSERTLEKEYQRMNVNVDADWSRRYRKMGKYMSIKTTLQYAPNNSDQNQQAGNKYYNENGTVKYVINTNQLRRNESLNKSVNTSFNYGNRINKFTTWSAGYNFNLLQNDNKISTMNRENGNLGNPIDSLSNNYRFGQTKNNIFGGINYNRKKWNYWLNATIGSTHFSQAYLAPNAAHNPDQKRNFINFMPRAGATYTYQKQSNAQFYYSGNTQAPSISALQPVVNNTDPFNLTVGNQKLTQAFNHSANLSLYSNKTVKGRYMRAELGLDVPRNAFVTSTNVDTNGVRRVQTVNANGNYSADADFNYNIRMKKIPLWFEIELKGSNRKNISFTNGQKIETYNNQQEISAGLNLNTDAINFDIRYSISYNQNKNNLGNSTSANYIIQNPSYNLMINLPAKFVLYSSGDFNIRPASGVFNQGRNVFYMVAGAGKYFGKKRNLELSFMVNDLLKQNQGFSRNISTNLVSEQVYTQLTRYWLLGLKWNFASAGGNKDED